MRSHAAIHVACLIATACTGQWARAAPDSAELALKRAEAIHRAAQHVQSRVVQVRPIGDFQTIGGDAAGAKTGLVLDDRRWVLTSSFGLERRPSTILVATPDRETATATVASIDHGRHVALLELPAPLPGGAPPIAPRDDPTVGETVVAIGRAYAPDRASLAVGVVSATNRFYGRAVQTDAAVSPANYGGPLVDLRGRVVGVLTPLAPQGDRSGGAQWYDSGIGFAVPLGVIERRLERMKAGEDLHPGRLGVSLAPGNPFATRPEVASVAPDGPAAEAGVAEGDVIASLGGETVKSQKQLYFALGAYDAGDKVSIELRRDGETVRAEATLRKASDDERRRVDADELIKRLEIDPPEGE